MVLHLKACAAKQNFKTKLANYLIDALNARYGTIFNNKEMQCCLYLDPRYRSVILNDPIALEDTKLDLKNMWNRIKSMQATNSTVQTSNASSSSNFSFDEQAELEKSLAQNARVGCPSIEDAIDLFQPNPLSTKESVIDFWEGQKESILYDLAMALYSIPPTQVAIEDDFSVLGHVFTNRRYRLSQKRLEEIMLIKLNKEIFFKVKQEIINNA